jgi:hypothetical protein
MTDWNTTTAAKIEVGDRVKARGLELLVTRIDPKFLGRDEMCCIVESTDERWTCAPLPKDMEVEVLRG